MTPSDEGRPPEPPDYKVYRSRPGLLSRLRAPDLAALREKARGRRARQEGPGRPAGEGAERPRPPWRRILGWAGIAALVWILISVVAFAISAQIQKGKLADKVGPTLHGNPFLAVSPQTILVLGSDVRPSGLAAVGEASPPHCIKAAGEGKPPPKDCSPYRSDTIMLVRAGGGTFRKLSISRDTLADIPGRGPQKINSAYAFGGAKLTVQTVERFLGINVDQVAVIDFTGFRDFIDTIGGVKVDVNKKVCSEISGGADNGGFSLFVDPGEHTLSADEALTLTRTRENVPTDPDGDPCPPLTDLDRAAFQQDVIDGIKGRLTDPLRLPYNFVKGPFIAWNAPRAMVSSMGALTMPQLLLASVIGGGSGTDVLKPSETTPAGNLFIPQSECDRAVRKFLGGDPPRDPGCSPAP